MVAIECLICLCFLLEKNSHLYMEYELVLKNQLESVLFLFIFVTLAYQAKFRYGAYTTTYADTNL